MLSKKDFASMTDGSLFNYQFALLLGVITLGLCFLWCEVCWRNSVCPFTSEFVHRGHVTHETKPI